MAGSVMLLETKDLSKSFGALQVINHLDMGLPEDN
jgi:hypothetical protein